MLRLEHESLGSGCVTDGEVRWVVYLICASICVIGRFCAVVCYMVNNVGSVVV